MANTLRFKRGLASGLPTGLAGEPLFTTDTFDLYIGNGSGNTRFQKYIASGTTSQILRGDGSLYTFPLAISSPSTGQVLKYNGTSWVNDSDSGITGSGSAGQVAYFTGATTQAGSNNLFWDATNNRLGILTNTPTTSFHINSGASTQGGAIFGKGSYNYATVSQLGSSGDALFGAGVIASATAGEVAKSVGDVGHYIKMQISDGITFHTNITGAAGTSLARGTNERARFFASTGNFGINTGATDSGQRLQVVGTGYFSDSVGIGATALTGTNIRISKTITGSASPISVYIDGVIQSDATNTPNGFATTLGTQAASFTVSNIRHFNASQGTFGAGSTVLNQYGYWADSGLVGATNNYGFYGNIAAATGRWNLYMNGTANNYMAGRLAIGTTLNIANNSFQVARTMTGTVTNNGISSYGQIQSDVTTSARYFVSESSTQATTFTLNALIHYAAFQGTFGAGSTVSFQNGFYVDSTMIGATNNYGFRGVIPSGTNRWNIYMDGTALNYLNGSLLIGSTTDSGEKLQVTGTMKVTGNSAIGLSPSAWNSGSLGFEVSQSNRAGFVVEHFSSSNASAGNSVNIGTGFYRGTADGSFRYQNSFTKPQMMYFFDGATVWQQAAAGTAGNAITFTERMRLDASGNLGLGVTPSAWSSQFRAMHFLGNGASISGRTDVAAINVNSNWYWDGSNSRYIVNGFASTYRQYLGAHEWSTAPSGTAGNAITFTQAMTLYSTGNLAIGSAASDSGEKLQVTGTAKFTSDISLISSANAVLTIDALSTNTAAFIFKRSGTEAGRIAFSNSANMIFHTGSAATQRMVIDGSTGAVSVVNNFAVDTNTLFVDATNNRVGIGTASPSDTLHVVGNILATGGGAFEIMNSSLANVTFVRATGGGTNVMSTASWGNNIAIGTETAHDLILASNNTERMRLSSNGFLQHTNATNPTASVVDSYLQYSADVTAGNAAPHFRTENGAVIKLYQETTAVGNAIISLGGGNAVLDDTTFDGYTLRQIVKALRNQGILQ